jgi:hypothetical protein
MSVGFTKWTVLNNKPIEKLESNLWYVSGILGKRVERKMLIARREDGDLVIFNPIALDEPGMAELESFGRIAYIVAPNAFHRQDTLIWKQRYPQVKVVAPRGAHKAVSKAAPVDLVCDELSADPHMTLTHPAGFANKEALLLVRHGANQTVITCDALCNFPAKMPLPLQVLMGPIGMTSTPRAIRWLMLKDKAAWAAQLAELAPQTTRLIPGHGAVVVPASTGLLSAHKLLVG